MKRKAILESYFWPLVVGSAVGLLALCISTGLAIAAPGADPGQAITGATTPSAPETKACGDCHLDIANSWSHSPHAHAFDDPTFKERWLGMGQPGECMLCHTTNYQETTGKFTAEGVACEACHGKVEGQHPPAPVPLRADSDYCGSCHTTTLHEWRLTGHFSVGVGCTDCHDPHSQKALFEVADDTCLNCHKDEMGDYLNDLHIQKDIGCVDCHALVIPPEQMPQDGLVPTGHSFTVQAQTCVACHTDTLHAGFSLPGYENGAESAVKDQAAGDPAAGTGSANNAAQAVSPKPEERLQALEKQLQAAQAALASRGLTILFQGGVIGLVLGGSTGWMMAWNARRGKTEENYEEES